MEKYIGVICLKSKSQLLENKLEKLCLGMKRFLQFWETGRIPGKLKSCGFHIVSFRYCDFTY